MNTLQTIPHQNLTAWQQQGRVVKQWLGGFTGQLDWLAAYTRSPKLGLEWIDASHVTLLDTPLLGQYLVDITESLMQDQPAKEAGINKRALQGDDFSGVNGFSDLKKHRQTRYKKQDRNEVKQPSVLRKPGLQAKHTVPAESISRVGHIPAQADYTSLRLWSDTQSAGQSSNFEDELFDFGTFDNKVFVHSLPEHLRTKRESAVSNSNAVRQTQPQFQKEWSVYALRRVNKLLTGEDGSVNGGGAPDTIKKRRLKAVRRGFLLAEQWQSVIQDHYIPHELLMKIIAKTAPATSSEKINNRRDITAAFSGEPERETVIHKAPDKASIGSQRSENRQQKITPVTHEEMQSEFEVQFPPAFQRESSVQFRQQQQDHTAISPDFSDSLQPLKTVEKQAIESLLGATENNPAKIQQNDEELAMQIKRILDDEARRYGIDV